MKRKDGRGQQSLRTEDNNDESGCSGQREHESPTDSPIPTSNDDEATTAAAAMTNERSRTQRRSRRFSVLPSSHFPNTSASFYSLLKFQPLSSTFSWRHMYYAVFLICWIGSGVVAAPTDRNDRQPTVEILDGYVNYSVNGSSSVPTFQEISRNAFLQLKGTPVESRFRLGTAYQLESTEEVNHVNHVDHQSHVDHLTRHHRKKNRKPVGKLKKLGKDEHGDTVFEGRKHALLQLADPDALIMNQRCDGQKFKQRIRVDGCLTKVVVNRLCHGACASIFIPRMHSKKLKAAFRSCAACAPAEYDYVDITLDCPGRTPPTATKTIVKVKSCKCKEVRIAPF